jgi:hypothetical protein
MSAGRSTDRNIRTYDRSPILYRARARAASSGRVCSIDLSISPSLRWVRSISALDEATREEPAQHALDDRTERAVYLGEPLLVHAQELLAVLLDETKKRGFPRPARPVDPRTDLHATPTAGGRDRRE